MTKEKIKDEESRRKYKPKIRIIGDSHAKKCAAELRMISDHRYDIMGITKPGALMSDILTTAIDEAALLSNKDILILWARANDISKNNTNEAFKCRDTGFSDFVHRPDFS
jgi:hypothetical protein